MGIITERQPITDIHTFKSGRFGLLGAGYVGPQWFGDLMINITSIYNPLNATFITTDLPDGRYVVYELGNPNLITRRRKTLAGTGYGEGDAQLTTKGYNSRGSSYKNEFGEIVSARVSFDRKTLIVRRKSK